MSVILQTLVHNPFVRNYYLSEGHKQMDCEKESCVSCALDEMFVEFYSSDKNEGFGAVQMLLGSWLAGEVGFEHCVVDWSRLTSASGIGGLQSARRPRVYAVHSEYTPPY